MDINYLQIGTHPSHKDFSHTHNHYQSSYISQPDTIFMRTLLLVNILPVFCNHHDTPPLHDASEQTLVHSLFSSPKIKDCFEYG